MHNTPLLERWDEVDPIFSAALDLPEERREAFMRAQCGADQELLETLLSLLEVTDAAEAALELPDALSSKGGVAERAGEVVREDVVVPGQRVGRYRLVREIGRGGTGSVYLAERDDGAFQQQVAVKVLRRGLDTEDILARFRVERQILASLSHPNIARLLDGGATEDGRPYLVMELVEGQPITEYCDAKRLTIAKRLRLFIAVGQAVQHAHRNLVVHRDLKPSNILVTEEGAVKLLDFGIAKLLDAAAHGRATPQTRTGFQPMTPEYASPEQVLGEPITTASDIYQLGLLLYELLVGRRPYGSHGDSGQRLEELITHEDPPAPSTMVLRGGAAANGEPATAEVAIRRRLEPRRLGRVLRGDLDTIALKALRKEPERRYASVAELVEDIERYLDGRPVLARPDTWSYRARKLVRRRPGAVAAAVAVVLAAGGYTGTLQVHAERLERERDRARIEAEKARQVAGFMREVFTLSGPNVTKGEAVTARELLDEAARRLETRLNDQPPVRAVLLSAIAKVYQEYGLSERAIALYTDAVSARQAVATAHAADHAEDLRAIAYLLEKQQPERSDSLYREALALAERHAGQSHPVVGRILTDYGHSLSFRGAAPNDEVWQMYRRAIRIFRESTDDVREHLAHVLTISAYGSEGAQIIDGLTGLGRMREALELRIAAFGEESLDVAASMSDVALAVEHEDSEESVRLLRRAVQIMDKLVQKRHSLALTLLSNLAAVHRARGELDLAEPIFRETIALYEQVDPSDPSKAYPLSHLGELLNTLGRGAEAEPLVLEALDGFRTMQLGPQDIRILATGSRLATAMALQGRLTEAERELLSLDSSARSADGPPGTQYVLEALVGLYEAWGRAEEADRYRTELELHMARR